MSNFNDYQSVNNEIYLIYYKNMVIFMLLFDY